MNRANLRFDVPALLDPRVEEILAQARMAFVEKGFDGASMQDLARAAGMSAGNFYRYFPSKAAIVEAMVARDLDEVERDFAEIAGSARPMEALREKLRGRLGTDCEKDHPLWAEIMAAASRKPEIAAALHQMENEIRRLILRVFALACRIDEEVASLRYLAHAQLLMLLVRGAALENAHRMQPQNDLTALIMRTIDRLFEDIGQDAHQDSRGV